MHGKCRRSSAGSETQPSEAGIQSTWFELGLAGMMIYIELGSNLVHKHDYHLYDEATVGLYGRA
jgi:hypothetical protein